MDNSVPTAGSISIEAIDLLTSPEAGKETIDIRNYVGDVVIKESIFTNYFTMELSIGDSRNLLGNLPIMGGEIITVKFVSKHLSDTNPSQCIEQSFVVHSISERKFKDDREQFYVLRCITPEGYKNNTVVISERFTGSPKEIFTDIYTRFLKEPQVISQKGGTRDGPELNFMDVGGSQGFKKENICFISNYWTPYKCLNFLSNKCAPTAAGGKELMPNVRYFQSDKGTYAVSLSKMAAFYKEQNAIYDEFFYIPTGSDAFQLGEKRNARGGYNYISPFLSNKQNTMSGLNIPHFTNDLDDQLSGYQGNLTVGFDMTTRLPYHMEFDYTPLQPTRVEQNKRTIPTGYDDFYHIENNSPMRKVPLTNPRSSLNVQIGSSQMWTDQNFGYDWRFILDTAYRDTALAELKRLQIDFEVPGRTDIDLGMLVYLNFPNTSEKGRDPKPEDLFDERISGIYSITAVRHHISVATSSHRMKLEVVRDSVGDIS
tara:strand:- start:2022 stop:3476 length:1455 start_codon:yes stop_codon:yes gene_type:complete